MTALFFSMFGYVWLNLVVFELDGFKIGNRSQVQTYPPRLSESDRGQA